MRLPDLSQWTDAARARLALRGIGGAWLVWAAFAVGLSALPVVAWRHFWIGLGLILVSRALAAVAVRDDLAEALDTVFTASVPFAFALADPTRAIAACFLLFGFVANIAVAKRLARRDALVCTLAFALACALPDRFSLIAYGLGAFGFAAAGAHIAGAR